MRSDKAILKYSRIVLELRRFKHRDGPIYWTEKGIGIEMLDVLDFTPKVKSRIQGYANMNAVKNLIPLLLFWPLTPCIPSK